MTAAYAADWIVVDPASADAACVVLRQATLAVDDSGKIAAYKSGRQSDAIRLPGEAIVPLPVNAHCHLEFSDLSGPLVPATPFTAWLRRVLAHRRARDQSAETLVTQGWREAAVAGTAAIAEIQTSAVPPSALTAPHMHATQFREVIGPLPSQWPEQIAIAKAHLSHDLPPWLTAGLSPHAPYTVPLALLEPMVELARSQSVALAVHLAETPQEIEFLRSGTGDFAELLTSAGLMQPGVFPRNLRPLDWLQRIADAPRALIAHGNYLAEVELRFLADRPWMTLVYCPRTHAFFGHTAHPFRRLLQMGGRVALGTDGRSSNPDLDVWREGIFLQRRHPDLSSAEILKMLTTAGAESLGVTETCGQLRIGGAANFLTVRPSGPAASPDGLPDLFGPGAVVTGRYREGRRIDSA